jgi:hypothetical protein
MKTTTFKRLPITIEKTGYGNYKVRATYNKKPVVVMSDNSIAYDNVDDDSDVKKQKEAIRYYYNLVLDTYCHLY